MSSEKTYSVKIKATGEAMKVFEFMGKYVDILNHNDSYEKDELIFIHDN